MYKKDLALNNQQWLICHKPNPTKSTLKRSGMICVQHMYA